jgi:glycosyltransferase involved in cell wall biosynthesis
MKKPVLMRITTVAVSMNIILRGQLSYMNQFYEVVGVTSPDTKHFPDCAQREGIRMVAIPMQRTIHPWKDLVALVRLYKLMRIEHPSIVHTHTPKAGLLGMLAAWLIRVPVRIHTVGGMPLMEAKGIKKMLLVWAEKLTYFCAHKVLPNSTGLQEIILQHGLCRAEKLQVIGFGASNGVPSEYFHRDRLGDAQEVRMAVRAQLNLPQHLPVVLYVGRIAREKGIGELLQAFRNLQAKGTTFYLLFIGLPERIHGVLSIEDLSFIEESPYIVAPGRFDDVRPYYLAADLCVLPSYREGLPNTLLEAGAMGLPCIATDINGCNEIIEDDVNGLLVSPKSVNALESALNDLILNPEKRNRLASAARARIVERYDTQIVWKGLEQLYKDALKAANAA